MKKIICLIICLFVFIFSCYYIISNNDKNKLNRIYFGYWKPSMENPKDLKKNIQIIKDELTKDPKLKLELVGHAGRDFTKPDDYKEILIEMSQVRANAIKNELINHGISKDKICKVYGVGYKDAKTSPKNFKDEESYKKVNQFDRYVETKLIKCN